MDLHVARLVTAEVLSLIVCLIIGYGNRFEAKKKTKRGDIYFAMLVTNVISLIFDILSWELDENPDWKITAYASDLLSYCLTPVLLGEFAMYIGVTITERTKKRSRLVSSSVHLCCFLACIVFVLYFFGASSAFVIGGTVVELWYAVYIAGCVVSMVFTSIVILKNRKILGLHDTVISILYIVIPLASAVICLMISEFSCGYVASTISLLELYVFIQSEENGRLEAEGQTNKYYANHDELTGLLARRAFSERIDELEKQDGNVGVVFCDVNGLKYTNDHFGHIAGDKLLIDFAKKLESSFREDEVFRTGGDEFIVFVIQGSKTDFECKVSNFEKILHNGEDDIACMGAEYGSYRKIEDLVQMSENKMYLCKNEYHRNHPEQRSHL